MLRAFSLIELVIVLTILAIVVAIAIPRVSRAAAGAEVEVLVQQLRVAENAMMQHYVDTGVWPNDRGPGVTPPEVAKELPQGFFSRETPVGGKWDWNNGWGTFKVGMGINTPNPPVGRWMQIDKAIDDGNLNTGNVQRFNNNLLFRLQ